MTPAVPEPFGEIDIQIDPGATAMGRVGAVPFLRGFLRQRTAIPLDDRHEMGLIVHAHAGIMLHAGGWQRHQPIKIGQAVTHRSGLDHLDGCPILVIDRTRRSQDAGQVAQGIQRLPVDVPGLTERMRKLAQQVGHRGAIGLGPEPDRRFKEPVGMQAPPVWMVSEGLAGRSCRKSRASVSVAGKVLAAWVPEARSRSK